MKHKNNGLISVTAQGTIEYLVIVSVVIVISLIVVGMVITQVDSSANVTATSSEASSKIGVEGISISSSVAGADENGVLVIKNINPENFLLKKIIVDGVDHNFYEQIVAGDEKGFKLQDVASCVGEKKSYSVKVEYVSASGLTKIADFQTITVDCTEHATPVGAAVEEYKDPVCEGDQFLYRFPGSEYKRKCYSCSTNPSTGFFDTGEGSVNNPFMICDWNQLNNVRTNPNASFKLMTDLGTTDANYADFGADWEPIGPQDNCTDANCSTELQCEREVGCASIWKFAGDGYCSPSFTDIGDIELWYSSYCNQNESICDSECEGYWYEQKECLGNMSTYCSNHASSGEDCSLQNGCSWTASYCTGDMYNYCGNYYEGASTCNSHTGCSWTSWGGWCDGPEECLDYEQSTCQLHSPTCTWYDMGNCDPTIQCSEKNIEECSNYEGCSIVPGVCSSAGTECNSNYDGDSCESYPACDWNTNYTQCEMFLSGTSAQDVCNSNSQICPDCYFYNSSWSNQESGTWYVYLEDSCINSRCSTQETCEKTLGCASIWNNTSFGGFFDGGGWDGKLHEVKNLIINKPDESNLGLFSYVDGTISNLGISDINIIGDSYVGGIAAKLVNGTVTKSYTTGNLSNPSIVQNDYYSGEKGLKFGGLIGDVSGSSTISDSYSSCNILNSNTNVGGLVGTLNNTSTIYRSYSSGNLSGNGYMGGIAGAAYYGASISDSYSTSPLTYRIGIAGGLVGDASYDFKLNNCYSTSTSGASGLISHTHNLTISNSFTADDRLITRDWGNTIIQGASVKTLDELKSFNTFNNAGWDIALIENYTDENWAIADDINYPILGWQVGN